MISASIPAFRNYTTTLQEVRLRMRPFYLFQSAASAIARLERLCIADRGLFQNRAAARTADRAGRNPPACAKMLVEARTDDADSGTIANICGA
jgi:hypothetical protein